MKTNLLMVSHYFGTHRGGIEITADRLCRELSRHFPTEVHWSAIVPPPPLVESSDEGIRIPLHGWNGIEQFTGVPFPFPKFNDLRVLWKQVKWADVVMLYESIYIANYAAFLMARKAKKPVIIVQFLSTIPYRSRFLRAMMCVANRLLVNTAMSKADQVVFTSANTQSYFEERVRFRHPPELIYGGVDTSIFFPVDNQQRDQIRHALGIQKDRKVCLFVGRFVEKKGIHILKSLAQRMSESLWVMAGWGPIDPEGWQLDNLRIERNRSGVTLALLYQCADILVLPSVGEGFPLVIQEALACGLPVICSLDTIKADPGAAGYVHAELVDVRDTQNTVDLWEEKIGYLLQSIPVMFDKDGAVRYALEQWSWQRTAAQYSELIISLAQDAKVAPP